MDSDLGVAFILMGLIPLVSGIRYMVTRRADFWFDLYPFVLEKKPQLFGAIFTAMGTVTTLAGFLYWKELISFRVLIAAWITAMIFGIGGASIATLLLLGKMPGKK